jgi:PTH1 family peptidyl-tRNA hydrolase
MRIIAGLGNPGARYAGNRHNIGFMAVERIAAAHGLGPWRARFSGQAAEGTLGGERVLLLKPQTYMNESGRSVGEALRFHKLEPADLIVIHDDIDLAPGKVKVKTGGGHAGHNGLRSVSAHLGEGYHRLRLGVGHPGHKDRVADYVLHDFAKADQGWLDELMRGIEDGAADLARLDWAAFQNRVARRMAPPRPGRPAPEAKAAAPAPAPAAPEGGAMAMLRRLADRLR